MQQHSRGKPAGFLGDVVLGLSTGESYDSCMQAGFLSTGKKGSMFSVPDDPTAKVRQACWLTDCCVHLDGNSFAMHPQHMYFLASMPHMSAQAFLCTSECYGSCRFQSANMT